MLKWHATNEPRFACIHELGQPCERVLPRHAHVGIHEYEERMVRELCQLMTRKIFSAPACGQKSGGFKPHPRIVVRYFADDLSRTIA